jgi:tRNA(Ser,Leu) C12 N-acetylase TAN1
MELNPSTPTNQLRQQTTENTNAESIAKDRLESVDTIRQILFGEDRRVLDAKIQSLTETVEQLVKTHKEALTDLENRIRKAHDEETSTLTKMLVEANAKHKIALDALANSVAQAVRSSQAAFENKVSVLQIGMHTQSESSNAQIRELAQSNTNVLAQLKVESKTQHDSAMRSVEEKLISVDKKIVAATQSMTNYVTTKQFSDALRSLAKEFDTPLQTSTAQPFQR